MITRISITRRGLFDRGDIMKWTWKQVCALFFAVMVSESAYIVKASNGESFFIPEVDYYGNTQNVEVALTATKDIYTFQNAVHTYAPSLDIEQNGDVFVWGNVKYNPNDMKGNVAIEIEIGDKKTTIDTNLLTNETTQEVFFYVDGTDAFAVDEITNCTILYGENEMHVDMQAVNTEETSHPRLHEELTPNTR